MAVPENTPAYAGAQSISRAFTIFRLVAKAGVGGLRLRDAAMEAQLNQATAHRLLMALTTERAIVRDEVQRRYHISPEFLRLMDSARDEDLGRRYGELVSFVASKTGHSTYLSVPSGTDVVCISRLLGASIIQPIPFDIGERRPFGVGAAGVVALAGMPEYRIKSILEQHEPVFQSYGLSPHDVRQMVDETRESGFCYNRGLFIKGVSGLGLPIKGPKGNLLAILNIVALDEQLRPEPYRLGTVSLIRRAIERANEHLTA